MIDKKVSDLVVEFTKAANNLNAVWAKLQQHDVYVRCELKGTNTYTEPKQFVVDTIRQTVDYTPKAKAGK